MTITKETKPHKTGSVEIWRSSNEQKVDLVGLARYMKTIPEISARLSADESISPFVS